MLDETEKSKLIGKVYNYLIEAQIGYSLHKIYGDWNKDLKSSHLSNKWKECVHLTNILTTNENLGLIQYKLMTRIY